MSPTIKTTQNFFFFFFTFGVTKQLNKLLLLMPTIDILCPLSEESVGLSHMCSFHLGCNFNAHTGYKKTASLKSWLCATTNINRDANMQSRNFDDK